MPKKIRDRGNGKYELSVSAGYDSKGKQVMRSKTIAATSMRAAEKQYALFVAEIEKGQFSTSGKMTLTEYYKYWIENYANAHHAPKTIEYNNNLWPRIQQALGHKRIDKIEARHIIAFLGNLADDGVGKAKGKLSQNTIAKYYVLLHTLLEKATQWQLIAYNPAKNVDKPRLQKTVKDIYEKDEAQQFFAALKSESAKHQLMVHLLLSTGMRKGEMFGLQWKHIDFKNNTISVEQQCQSIPRIGKIIRNTKTDVEHKVSIPRQVADMLENHRNEQSQKRDLLRDKWVGAESPDNDFVFTMWNGEVAHPSSINSWLRKFTTDHNLKKITPHGFRHMSATYLINAGVDLVTVAGRLGHANTRTTQIVYSHLLKNTEKESAKIMGDMLDVLNKK